MQRAKMFNSHKLPTLRRKALDLVKRAPSQTVEL